MLIDYEEEVWCECEVSWVWCCRFQEMGQWMCMDSECVIWFLLDEFFLVGVFKGLLEWICFVQNWLIKDIVGSERVICELYDGINWIKNEFDLCWVDGFNECVWQVRVYVEELGVSELVVNSMLCGYVSMLEVEQVEKDQVVIWKVEWLCF